MDDAKRHSESRRRLLGGAAALTALTPLRSVADVGGVLDG